MMQDILIGKNESGAVGWPESELTPNFAVVEGEVSGLSAPTTIVDEPSFIVEPESERVIGEPATTFEPPAPIALDPLFAVADPFAVPDTPQPWTRRAAIAVVVALVAGLTFWGWTEHSSAADWKAKAGQLEVDLTATRADLKQTQANLASTKSDLTETKTQLAATESQLAGTETQLADTKILLADVRSQLSDVTAQLATASAQVSDLTVERDSLVAQVGTLANDKAQVEDERAQLSAVLSKAPAMTAALRACMVSSTDISIELLNVIEAYPYRTLDKTSRLIDTASTLCKDAFAKTNDFESTLTALGV